MMNAESELESLHSSFRPKLECEFATRVREVIGDHTVHSFAKKCGTSDSLVRKYLAGSLPRLDKLVAIAEAGGVRVGWLATGELPKYPVEQGQVEAEKPQQASQQPAPDFDALEEVVTRLGRLLEESNLILTPEAEGRMVRLIYEYHLTQGKEMDSNTMGNVLRLVANNR